MTWQWPLDAFEYIFPDYPGTFGSKRKYDRHTGVDLYCSAETPVLSVEPGVVIGIQCFTGTAAGSPWWNDTCCVLVCGATGVINYGELNYNRGLKVGGFLPAGSCLGSVATVLKKDKGRPMAMLHLEIYSSFDGLLDWPLNEEQPPALVDPMPYLIKAAAGQRLTYSHEAWNPSSVAYYSNDVRIYNPYKMHEMTIRHWSGAKGVYSARREINKTMVSVKTWYESGRADLSVSHRASGARHGIMSKYDDGGEEIYYRYFLYGTEVTEDDYIKHNIIAELSGVDTN